MKNLKVVVTLLPVLILGSFIYFSTIGFSKIDEVTSSISKNKIEKLYEVKEKPSNTVSVWIILTSSNGRCLTGYYEICLNGVNIGVQTTEGFYLNVPCDKEFTLCIKDGDCYGTYTGIVNCNSDTFRIINMSDSNPHCDCF